ncbi:MAG: biotin-dependent carboxyltransferase family protein [Granulosicoccus sp.]|nr:biotin-dependent carboxyltransferase family protein [Granulosicoccus sp.]
MTTRLKVISAGPAVSLQDLGRPGYCRYGLSKGGAMDPYAMAEGAALLGNECDAAAIEMAGFGGKYRAEGGGIYAALTGAPMKSSIRSQAVSWRTIFYIREGDTLEVGGTLEDQGVYGYLHVRGGFQVTPEIGSISTHIRAGIGGINGKALSAGTLLSLDKIDDQDLKISRLPTPNHLSRDYLRILWGAQSNRFSQETRDRLLGETFCISHRRDRMAMRLTPLNSEQPFEALLSGLSDPVQDGEVQMTGDGVPAIVMREHQPTGGYPRIASVISADLAAAAQIPTGVPFRFQLVDDEAATEALREWRRKISQLPSLVRPVVRSPHQIQNLLDYNLIDGVVSARDFNE